MTNESYSPRTEWLVEVTWRDWKKAGAKGPTSEYGPMETEEQRDSFLDWMRRDRDIVATRVLERRAYYTPWTGPEEVSVVTDEEREARLAEYHQRILSGEG